MNDMIDKTGWTKTTFGEVCRNLNTTERTGKFEEPAENYTSLRWQYLPADQLARETTEVLLESEVKKSLARLNPEIAAAK